MQHHQISHLAVLVSELAKNGLPTGGSKKDSEAAHQTRQAFILEQLTHVNNWIHKFNPMREDTIVDISLGDLKKISKASLADGGSNILEPKSAFPSISQLADLGQVHSNP